MFLTLKSPVFIDHLVFQIQQPLHCLVRAVLKDDAGFVCSALETELTDNDQILNWNGLNDLPYGVYTLEASDGADEVKMKLVKRV